MYMVVAHPDRLAMTQNLQPCALEQACIQHGRGIQHGVARRPLNGKGADCARDSHVEKKKSVRAQAGRQMCHYTFS